MTNATNDYAQLLTTPRTLCCHCYFWYDGEDEPWGTINGCLIQHQASPRLYLTRKKSTCKKFIHE